MTLLSASITLLDSKLARLITFGGICVLMIFVFVFFRSPPVDKTAYPRHHVLDMVSPADGTVLGIDVIPQDQIKRDYGQMIRPFSAPPEATKNMRRISIFLNLHDKHFQVAPCDSLVTHITYKRGEFHPAGLFEKSQYNERTILDMAAISDGKQKDSIPVVNYYIVLIAGMIARRILIFPESEHQGAFVKRGMKFSVIRFGSRVDLIVPIDYQIQVQVGDAVKVGETVLATWNR